MAPPQTRRLVRPEIARPGPGIPHPSPSAPASAATTASHQRSRYQETTWPTGRRHRRRHQRRLYLLIRPGSEAQCRDQHVCLCVRASVREHISELAYTSDLHQIFIHLRLGPPLAALRYVTYFRFYE